MNDTKEVYFCDWCKKCVHYPESEDVDPCDSCLTQGFNYDTHKPLYFKEDE